MTFKVRCLAPNKRGGGLCQNYRDTCPIEAHKRERKEPPTARIEWAVGDADREAGAPLFDSPLLFRHLVKESASAYQIEEELVETDYWLVRTLHAWLTAVGDDAVPRGYPDPKEPLAAQSVGRLVFGGGTSLSAAWGITERWSQDIDLILAPVEGVAPKQLRQACKKATMAASAQIGCSFRETSRSQGHYFLEFRKHKREVSSIDIVIRDVEEPPMWTQKVPVMSMIGRVCGVELLQAHPELGGFEFNTLGPGTTAMNKLLAQTEMSASGDLGRIRERARDVYDLACIAISAADFEGHIGRDSKALLWVAESWRHEHAPGRPEDGFASLRSFDPSTREYEALAEGYEAVIEEMVWGEAIPLPEAIALALSLDPGPPRPLPPLVPSPYVAYPSTPGYTFTR